MGQKVLILGDSGTGKSASMRNFKPEEILVINVAGKTLPFKNHFTLATPTFEKLTDQVLQAMQNSKKKVIVVDDAQYIMSFQYMRRIKENGWDKWNDIQGDFFNIIKAVDDLPDDVVVYFLSHLQRDDEGHEKIKTMGKMLDEKITIEGLFTIVLKTNVTDGKYCFLTQNSGKDTVKSPIGMFPSYAIDNDLKYVDTKIRNYYEIGDFKNDEEVAQMDQEAAKVEITKEAAGDRRSRRRKTSSSEETTESEGSGNVDGQGNVSEPAPSDEAPVEKQRKRKVRTEDNGEKEEEKPAEAPTEEAKEEGSGKHERRRRQRKDGFLNIPEGMDEELPFK